MSIKKKKKIYYTHDNYNRAFKVVIEGKKVYVYKHIGWDEDTDESIYSEKSIKYLKKDYFKCKKIFVGKSLKTKITEMSGAHGHKFTGNSILLELGENKYVFIGKFVFSFKSYSPIKKYVSPVRGSDVSYPYAIDIDDRYYLMIEDVVIEKIPNIKLFDNEPYNYYYNISKNNNDILNIKQFYIGNKPYTFNFHIDPNKNYDRLKSSPSNKPYALHWGEGMKIEYNNGDIEMIDKKTYARLNRKIGNELGFKKLLYKKMMGEPLYW
tara:strand:+ start:656 stop:1453 length:798 start_codon:yes stop_codon:yes gene_type:complete